MLFYFLLIFLFFVLVFFIWRFYSNNHTAPCPAWLAWLVELDNPFAKAHQAKHIIHTLPLQNRINILDFGCGPGRLLIPLAQKIAPINGHITGIDLQPEMIAKTAEKMYSLGLTNVSLIAGTMKDGTLSNINDAILIVSVLYDVILMVSVLGEIRNNDRKNLIDIMATYLKPSGIISITETVFDPHFQTHGTVTQLMKECGFTEIKYIGNWLAYTAHFKKI